MANLNNFNAHDVDPLKAFEPIPPGKYPAIITDSEMKPTKSGNGEYLKLTLQIIEGEYENRNLWVQLNLNNPSLKAVQIARAELSSICRAVGVMEPRESLELHDRPLLIKVVCRVREDTGDMVNEVKGYTMINGAGEQPPQKENDTPPWKKRQ